jgi:hypothetical protein
MLAETSYEFITENVWDRPGLYKRSFDSVKGYVKFLQSFEDLRHLSSFLWSGVEGVERMRDRLSNKLRRLGRRMPLLRNAVLEVLLFARRDQIVPVDIDEPQRFDEVFHRNLMKYVFLDMEKCNRESEPQMTQINTD